MRMPTSIFVKFRAHLSDLRQIQKIEEYSLADIPQIAVVASVKLHFCCSCYVFGQTFVHFLFAKRVKFCAIFTGSSKTVSRAFWFLSLFLAMSCTVDVILPDIAKKYLPNQ